MFTKLFIFFLLGHVVCGNSLETPLTVVDPTQLARLHASKVNHHLDPEVLDFLTNLKTTIFNKNLLASASNNTCEDSIKQFVNDCLSLKEPYALAMLDSWFKPESGILDGNTVWEGRYYECVNTQGPTFNGRFCDAAIQLPSSFSPYGPLQKAYLTMAMCFPDNCSTADINAFLAQYNSSGLLPGVTCPSAGYPQWKAKEILALFLSIFLGLLVVLSTMYDFFYVSASRVGKHHLSLNAEALSLPEANQSKLQRVLLSFSVIQNTKRLLTTKRRSTDIDCLHGMRFLSMSWVILGHSFLFLLTYTDNPKFFARYVIDHYEFQVIMSAFYSVDSFFYLSGLLVAYLGLRELNKRDGKMNVPMMYLYRYIRLTPPYAFVLLISITLWPKFGQGPFWMSTAQPMIDACEKYWYTNLLYFNNLYPAELVAECIGWSWYLANDTQFYLLTPLFLWVLYKSWKWGLALISFFLVSSMAITGAFSAHTNQQAQTMTFGLLAKGAASPLRFPNQTESLYEAAGSEKQPSVYMADLYAKPWCRIGAYLVGMITGYILHAYNNRVPMHKAVAALGWLLAFFINFELMYGLYPSYSIGQPWSLSLAAFYNAVCRPAWCVGLAWVTIACVSGCGGPVNTLLSWKLFIPLSRLTYCSYLIHPLVIYWFLGTDEVQRHYDIYQAVMLFLTALVITTLLAYVVAMLIEFPVIELMKILQDKSRTPGQPSAQELSFSTQDETPLLPEET